jgi:hypothetical protein
MAAGAARAELPRAEYEDRVKGAWYGQIIGTLLGFPFEHKVASREWISRLDRKLDAIPVDDDYYYELVALRAFEKYGPSLTVDQLGEQWKENNAGSWGSSEQTRLLLARGVKGSETGHPRYNKLWFSIGPQFSADIYGMLAPGDPRKAAALARRLARINGWAEGLDGAVFVASMVSAAFDSKDPRQIVERAAALIDARSPYRQCIDQAIALARAGKSFDDVAQAVQDRWHLEYPATNNAVANGGIVAASVWFGGGDYLKTLNLAFRGGDFTDADCNAANAGAVVGAMKGTAAIPRELLDQVGDRIRGSEMGGVGVVPPVDESVAEIAARTVRIGFALATTRVAEPPTELFDINELTRWWNPAWRLERAGVGGAGGGMKGIRGNTYLDGDTLATYPRDEVRGVVLRRTMKIEPGQWLRFSAGADAGRAWKLEVYVGNTRLRSQIIEGMGAARTWIPIEVDLAEFSGRETEMRLYQLVLLDGKTAGNAYWRGLH